MNNQFQASGFMPVLGLLALLLAGCERPPVDTEQQGFRGTGMVEVTNPRRFEDRAMRMRIPEPPAAVQETGRTAAEVYENVEVLGDLDEAQFNRFMVAITQWVAPEQGCAYCHAGNDFAAENVYTKTVSRRMIEMNLAINQDWNDHVGDTGVTCFTCHQGNNVPAETWSTNPGQPRAAGFTASSAGQNAPASAAGMSSLPYDPFTPFLLGDTELRVLANQALPDGTPLPATKQTEETFSLMVHMSEALGVNCTYCHNSRDFGDWAASSPARVTAWHGIRMARELNNRFIEPLTEELPEERLGPTGDAPKVNCATCHQGFQQPLMGADLLQYHPELAGDR